MNKKEYQMFADSVSCIKDNETRENMMSFLFTIFRQDNQRFDGSRFREWVKRRVNNESMKGMKFNPKYMPLGNEPV